MSCHDHTIRAISADLQHFSTVAGIAHKSSSTAPPSSYSPRTEPALRTKFNLPEGMAALADGSVLICDTHNNCIRSLSADLRTVTTVTGSTWSAGHKDGPVCQAQFDRPTGILRLRDNRMLVCQHDCTIRILSPDLKEVYTLCGTPYDDGYRCGVHFPLVDGKAADAVSLAADEQVEAHNC